MMSDATFDTHALRYRGRAAQRASVIVDERSLFNRLVPR